MGLGLWPVIETEDGDYGVDQRCRQMDAALANAVLNSVDRLLLEHDAEGLLHVGGGAGKPDGAARERGGIRFDLQVELASEGADQRNSRGVGGMLLLDTRRG